MNDHEQINDSALTGELRESLTGIIAPQRPPLETITARGRAHQRHRLTGIAGLATAGVAAGIALALGLTGALGSPPARGMATIRTAAFTLTRNANGTDTLTINPDVLLEPTTLQNDLQQYGIPAIVNTGSLCTSDPAPAGFSQVVSARPTGSGTATPGRGIQPIFTIDPSAMPSGTELSFGYFQLTSGQASREQQADVVLIDTSSYTCSSTPPNPNGLPDGYGPSDGIGLLYGGPGPGS
jgi:hypothetical protein